MAALIKKDFMLLKKYVLFIIVIVFALPAALAAKSNEVNMVQSTMAFAFEVIYSEFLICRYLAMKEYQNQKQRVFYVRLFLAKGIEKLTSLVYNITNIISYGGDFCGKKRTEYRPYRGGCCRAYC